MIEFRPVTQGEWLYTTFVRSFVNERDSLNNALTGFRNSMLVGRRSSEFADYCFGLYCFNVTARLIKAARWILSQEQLGEPFYRGNMLDFLVNQFEISEFRYGRPKVNLLVNLAFEAARCSGQPISMRTKEEVIKGHQEIHCYMCGNEVFTRSSVQAKIVQYEHIWPSSYGGESSIENLLPACSVCNAAKGALLLWQDGPVHSFILPPNPTENDRGAISRQAKIAKHRQDIFAFAHREKMTLKNAALELGPYDFANVSFADPSDSADFFTFHF